MKKRILVSALTAALAAAGAAQAERGNVSMSGDQDNTRLSYYGDDTRFGLGINHEGDLLGELFHVLGSDHDSAWIGEGWYNRRAAGLKMSYHWIPGQHDEASLAENAENLRVWKAFAAIDQNRDRDRKATVGGGFERDNTFFGAYYSHGLTGERQIDTSISISERVIEDFLDGRPFRQTETTTTTTDVFQRAYNHGVGVRLGRFYDESLWRVQGGLDYERGRFSSDQWTASLGVEKFIANSSHSFALNAEHLRKSGDFEIDTSDTRANLVWRYSFGRTHRPAIRYEEVPVERVMEQSRTETRVVRNEANVEADTFFAFDSAELRPDAIEVLRGLADRVNREQVVGRISIVGHTCDIGPESYNQGLSERRARSVYNKLIELGVDADKLNYEGRGETQPRYPNDSRSNRQRNRRVDIDFVSLEETTEQVEVEPSTELVMERREIAQAPAWMHRALRNPVQHKRTVDTYRIERESVEVELSDREFINRPPAANDVDTTVVRGTATFIDVLENDSDPDGDPLTVASVTQPANGVVTNFGEFVEYTPNDGFIGQDSFTYTISDGQGGEATAEVRIQVVDTAPEAGDISVETEFETPVDIDVLDFVDSASEVTLTSVSEPGNGTAEIIGDQVRYTPAQGFSGTDSFTYTVETDAGTSTGTISVTVAEGPDAGPNEPPVANSIFQTTRSLTDPVVVDVLRNDSDPDGDPLTVTEVSDLPDPSIGTVVINDDNTVTFTPGPDWDGREVRFTYTITDGRGGFASAQVRIICI